MGFKVERRPILTPGVLASVVTSTVGPADLTSDIAMEGTLKLSTEAVSASTAAKTLSDDGVSFVTVASSGKANDIILPNPLYPGQVKHVFFDNQTTSVELNVNTVATANTFWGTTFNTVTCSAASTGSPGGTPGGSMSLTLVAASTTRWALIAGTTFNWDLSASTGSTATP